MSSLIDIVKALRDRLESNGIRTTTSPVIDEKEEELPSVMLFLAGDGDSTQTVHPMHKKSVTIVADMRYRYQTDWLLEGAALKRHLERAIYQGRIPDLGDRLDGTAISLTPIKTIITPEAEHRIASVQVQVAVSYIEESKKC